MKIDLTQEIVRELIDYDPVSGKLTWKERSAKWFKDGYRTAQSNANIWNSLWAGKEAFTSDNGDGYKSGAILGNSLKAHRLIWFYVKGYWPEEVDHENGYRSDNRWKNLKEVDNIGNGRNQKLHTTNTSGYQGVHFRKDVNRWQARITVNGFRHSLGFYENFEDAVAARKKAEIEYSFHQNHGRLK